MLKKCKIQQMSEACRRHIINAVYVPLACLVYVDISRWCAFHARLCSKDFLSMIKHFGAFGLCFLHVMNKFNAPYRRIEYALN